MRNNEPLKDLSGREFKVDDYLVHCSRRGSNMELHYRKVVAIGHERKNWNDEQEFVNDIRVVGIQERWNGEDWIEIACSSFIIAGEYCVIVRPEDVPTEIRQHLQHAHRDKKLYFRTETNLCDDH